MPHSPPQLTDHERRNILIVLSAVVFIAVTTGTMINVALPFIGAHFSVSEATYSWIVTGYTLTFGVFSAIHGRLADVYGMRRLYTLGLYIFGIGAVIVAIAPAIEIIIPLRLIQGAGAAALPSLGSAIIARLWPPERRGEAMGVIMGTVGIAASIGPFLGGLLLEAFGWRSVFLFTALVLTAVPFVYRLLPASLDETAKRRFDVVGAALLGLGAAGVMYSFNLLAGHGFGAMLLLCLGVSGTLLGLFVVWIRRHRQPFVRPGLFSDSRFVASVVVAPLANATRFGTIVLVPILLVEVAHESALVVGSVLFPGALCIAFFSPRAGRWADRVGARRPVFLGVLVVSAGIVVTGLTAGASLIGVGLGMTLYGLGFAFVQSPLMGAASRILPPREAGVGLGMFLMIFFLGGALGVAFTVTTVELQPAGATSWLGLDLGGGAPFSNAIFLLLAFTAISLLFVPRLPGANPEPMGEAPISAEHAVVSPYLSSDL